MFVGRVSPQRRRGGRELAEKKPFTDGVCAKTQVGVLFLVLFFLFTCSIVAQTQTPPRSSPSPAATPGKSQSEKPNAPSIIPTGTIKGRVIADDGRVMSNATVIARAANSAAAFKSSRVDAEGRFTLDELPAAVYVVYAMAPGYVDESMSAGDPEQWPRYLIGSQVRIRLVKGGVITGSVTNSKGQTVVGIPIRAAPIKGMNFFANFQGATGMSETDDRGIYRIYGLPPGQYTVEAGGGGPFGRFSSTGFDLDVPTYYPSSTRDTAVPVAVRAGEEATGIDIRHKATAGHSISGTVSGKSDAVSANPISVLLSHAGTTNIAGMSIASMTEPGRSFGFDGVADGEYDLFAVFMTSPTDNAAAGSRRLTVAGGDVTGVELAMNPLGSIAGTIKLDTIAPEAKCDKRGSQPIEIVIRVRGDDPKKSGNKVLATMFSAFSSTLSLNGDFSVRNLEPGTFLFGVKLPTDAWYVRAINPPTGRGAQSAAATADQSPASGPGRASNPGPAKFWPGTVAIKAGERISGVSILVGQDAAGLRGKIAATPEGNDITPGLRVHLVPAEREEAGSVLRYFEATVESNGSFAFTNIAPGRYFVIPRLETPSTTETAPRPVALDATARAALRREAETLNNVVELKPCQRVVDLALKPKP
jgi:carboxypeptidase family protein